MNAGIGARLRIVGLILLAGWCAPLAACAGGPDSADPPGAAGGMAWVKVSADGRGFVAGDDQRPFTPWGFNYDHDHPGRLIEDYWHEEWTSVEQDFAEMKALGANVVRIHLQVGKFMSSPTEANVRELERLGRLVKLAERMGLYLDVTGLGCYHKKDVPGWYDDMTEQERWDVQARFWKAVAKVCAKSPAIFCYDLMNEPVVGGANEVAKEWLGPAFAGKHFVQRITRTVNGRKREDVARQWVAHLRKAIREVDDRHLITVGLVHWSLKRPGLNSGFFPEAIADQLDFIAVHLYPEKGKVTDALTTLEGFAVGKPIVIEETFPLKSSMKEFEEFMTESRRLAAGWIGFYWGKPIDELKAEGTIGAAITAQWLEYFKDQAEKMTASR